MSQQIVSSIEDKFTVLSNMFKEASVNVEYKNSYTAEKTSLQMNDINSMSSILIALAAQHDRVNHVYMYGYSSCANCF